MTEYLNYLNYNAPVILSFFFICLGAYILGKITKGKSTNLLFCTRHESILNPLTWIRMFTHIIGHSNWAHFRNNFLTILLIGPMIEEKYGSINLLVMILITAAVTGILNYLFSKYSLLGASGIVYMLIILGSFVNIQVGKIPITLILIFLFYIVDEVSGLVFKKHDGISHSGHLIGAIIGCIYGICIM